MKAEVHSWDLWLEKLVLEQSMENDDAQEDAVEDRKEECYLQ